MIVDVHELRLPENTPAGEYTLYIGYYDAIGGGRVPLYNVTGARLGDDRAPVGVILVEDF